MRHPDGTDGMDVLLHNQFAIRHFQRTIPPRCLLVETAPLPAVHRAKTARPIFYWKLLVRRIIRLQIRERGRRRHTFLIWIDSRPHVFDPKFQIRTSRAWRMRVRKADGNRANLRKIHNIAFAAARFRRRTVMPESEIDRHQSKLPPFRRHGNRRDPAGAVRLDQFDAHAPHVRIAFRRKTHQIMPFREHTQARRGVRRPSHQRIQLIMKAIRAFYRHLRLDVFFAHGKIP